MSVALGEEAEAASRFAGLAHDVEARALLAGLGHSKKEVRARALAAALAIVARDVAQMDLKRELKETP
jgi:hypothetical protein